MRHPVIGNRSGLMVWLAAGVLLAAGQTFLYLFSIGGETILIIVDAIVSMTVFSVFALATWFPLGALNKNKNGYLSHILNITLVGFAAIALWIIIGRLILSLLFVDFISFWEASLTYRIGEGVFLYVMVVLSYYLVVTLENLSEKRARESELESLVKETELKMLRSQINPHFLFNSLNSVSSLTLTDPEKSREIVIKLSEFMRHALSGKNDKPVPLSSELERVRLYIDIEKIRFRERMVVEEVVDENCLGLKLPVMLLQPLYENAVKHGVYESTKSVTIKTRISCQQGSVEIEISNNYDTDAVPVRGTGTGLINTGRRLELQYGKRASMETIKKDGLFVLRLVIPYTEG